MLRLTKIYKDYQVDNKPFPALKDINIEFEKQGFVSILGPSGCGKTTLLNLIGGLDQYTSGDLIINNKSTKDFTDKDWDAYRNKRVGFVFQSYNLVPHLTVIGNVELSMALNGESAKSRHNKAMKALKKVGLETTANKKPNQLSGGQMQRVAIARSLVNNPEIILADEPTGALDSKTGIQVMEILKEVSKKRLVIMVTHNDELAKQYSTRIIRLKDGKVISDTFKGEVKDLPEKELKKEENKHTHMSFRTALNSSFKSLLTKKGRTVLTAIATSFGIIGVALVLAMSNGFSNYVKNVEAATASTVPITISPFVTTSIKETELPEAWPSEQVIKPYDQDISQLVTIHRNKITKEYAEYCRGLLSGKTHYASSVLDNHEYLDFNIFTTRGSEIIKVNQFAAAGAGGSILSGVTGLPSTIFHELYGDKEYIDSLYDVINGEYPSSELVKGNDGCLHGEVCIVCDRYNRIPTSTLYKLGLSTSSSLPEGSTIEFKNLIGHEYKTYMPEPVYKAVSEYPLEFTLHGGEGGDFVKISDTDVRELVYPAEEETKTIKSYIDVGATNQDGTPVYKEQLQSLYDNDEINKPIKLKVTGIIRPKRSSLINLMPGSVCYTPTLKQYYLENIKKSEFAKEVAEQAKNNFYIPSEMKSPLFEDAWKTFVALCCSVTLSGNSSNLDSVLQTNLVFRSYGMLTNAKNEEEFFSSASVTDYLRSNARFSNELFNKPVFTDPVETQGYLVPTNVDRSSIDDISDVISYVKGYSTITSILVFPKALGDKPKVFSYLDAWNNNKPEIDQIKYGDIAGTLTDAVGVMIDIISIVLICFSAISLLVSCVMTGIITYTSVLERTKEIGILRAIGARKKDVGRLFEAESVIIGFVAGMIGILFSYIAELPISFGINSAFPEQNIGMICDLNPLHAFLLVVVSILLTFIAGFIPARKAAKKDPVVALRSE